MSDNNNLSIIEKIANLLPINRKKMFIWLGIITAVALFIGIYLALIPFNFHNGTFRFFLTALLLLWSLPLFFVDKNAVTSKPFYKSWWQIPFYLACGFIVVNVCFSLITSPLFMAKNYRNLITVDESKTFSEKVENYNDMQIPVVDKALAEKLGDKLLGEDNLGSQFNVGEYYMICHDKTPNDDSTGSNLYWVAPIEYNGLFQWMERRTSPGYIIINALDRNDAELVKTPLKYTSSAYFSEDLNRQKYFNNMTAWRANDAHLELTDEGAPMFVETVYTNRIGYTNGRDIVGIIVTDAVSGESTYYDYLNAPTWINHVVSEDLAVEQLNYWGTYVNGFFNSVFARNGVLNVSTGLNYVYSNGDMYLQTGMTSVGGDESIVGVMMVNMRTKETSFHKIAGATEYAAAESAKGLEQDMRYTASDPIMINLDGEPTYFILLKDAEGLVKKYAYVNVKNYSTVASAETQTSAIAQYKALLNNSTGAPTQSYTFTVKEISSHIESGNTVYDFLLTPTTTIEGFVENRVFTAKYDLSSYLPFIKTGDVVEITYSEYKTTTDTIYVITSLSKAE